MPVYILFNKNSKKLISYTDDISQLPKDNFLIKEIDTESLGITNGEFNLARYKWEGDYDNGKLIDMVAERLAIVSEEDIERKYYELFFRKFSLEQVLLELVRAMPQAHPMKNFLRALDTKKTKEIAFYTDSPNHIYETKASAQERIKEAFSVDSAG